MCMEQLQIARAGPMATAVLRARGALGLSLRLPGVPLSGLGFRVYGLGFRVECSFKASFKDYIGA